MSAADNIIKIVFGYKGSENLIERKTLQHTLDCIGIGTGYDPLGLIGVGVEGAVIKAHSRKTGKYVAIKIASPDLLAKGRKSTRVFGLNRFSHDDENKFKKRWIRGCEVQRILAESLPASSVLCVPKIVELIQTPLTAIMEFLDGVSVLRWVAEQKNFKASMLLFCRVLRAAAEMHRLKIIHRDLKPENIFITGDSVENARIGVVDWTLSKFLGADDLTTLDEKLHVGTAPYASPKLMIDGDSVAANTSDDVFSLGVMLAEFCSFHKVARPTNLAQITQSKTAFDSYISRVGADVNPLLREIFRRATAMDEDKRYNSSSLFLQEFEATIKKAGFFDQANVYNMNPNQMRDEVLRHSRILAEIQSLILQEIQDDEKNIFGDIADSVDFSDM